MYNCSYISSVTLTGVPGEIYTFGTIYLYSYMFLPIAVIVSVHLYIPVFRQLQIISIYQVSFYFLYFIFQQKKFSCRKCTIQFDLLKGQSINRSGIIYGFDNVLCLYVYIWVDYTCTYIHMYLVFFKIALNIFLQIFSNL